MTVTSWSETFSFVRVILRFLHVTIVRGNGLLFSSVVAFGALNKLFSLLGVALTFKAIITAFAPEATLRMVNNILGGFGISLDISEFMVIISGAVLFAYLGSWACQLLGDKLKSMLVWRVLKREELFAPTRMIEDDLFMIEDMVPIVDTVVRILEIIAFCGIFLAVIMFFATKLLLMLLPLLALFIFSIVLYERQTLRRRRQQKETRSRYVNQADPDGALHPREHPANTVERDEYIQARAALQGISASSARKGTLISGVIMILIIVYVAHLEVNLGNFPFLSIFIVVSIRTLVNFSQQLGKQLSRVLELRGKLNHLACEVYDQGKPTSATTARTQDVAG